MSFDMLKAAQKIADNLRGTTIKEQHVRAMLGDSFGNEWLKTSGQVFEASNHGPRIIDQDLNALLGKIERSKAGAKGLASLGDRAQRSISTARSNILFATDALSKGKENALSQIAEHVGDLSEKLQELATGADANFKDGALSHSHPIAGTDKTMAAHLGAAHDPATKIHTVTIDGKQYKFHDAAAVKANPELAVKNQVMFGDAQEALRNWEGKAAGLIEEGAQAHLDKLESAEAHLLERASGVATKTGVATKAPADRWFKKAPASTNATVAEAEAAAEKAAAGGKGKLTFASGAAAVMGGAATLIGGKALLQDVGMLEAPRGPDGEPEKGNFLIDAAVTAAGIAGLLYAHRAYHGAGVGHTAA